MTINIRILRSSFLRRWDLRSSHRHNGEKTWLGLNDKSVEGNFTWADRGEGNFTAWAKNQPYNYKEEDCVHAFGVKHNYEWNDVQCRDCHQFTCKKSKGTKKGFRSQINIRNSISQSKFNNECFSKINRHNLLRETNFITIKLIQRSPFWIMSYDVI